MRHRTVIVRGLIASCLFLAAASLSWGQTTIFNSNGFENPAFTAKAINGQQGFKVLPIDPNSGIIQSATVRSGSQAFQAVGPAMTVPGFDGTGANFWFNDSFTYNPGTALTPFVQVRFSGRLNSAFSGGMPGAGVYLEGLNTQGNQQGLVQLELLSDGTMTVSTATIFGDLYVTSAPGSFPTNQWHDILAELNFTTQSYRVYREGNSAPIQFVDGFGLTYTDIPFRNFSGFQTATVKEIGMLAFNNHFGGESLSQSSAFIDNYSVTASSSSLVPVPEPSLMLAAGAFGLAGLHAIRRRRRGANGSLIAASA